MSKHNLLGDTVLRRSEEGQLYLMNRKVGGWGARAIPIESEQWLLDHYNVRVGEWESNNHGPCCPVIRVTQEEQPTLVEGDGVKIHDFGPRGVNTEPSVVGSMEHSVIAPFLREGLTEGEALKALMGGHVRTVVFTEGSMALGVGGSLTLGGGDKEAVAVKVRLDSGPFPEGTLVPVKSLSEIRELSKAQALGQALYEEGALEDQCYNGALSAGMKEFISSHPGVRVCLGPEGVYVALMPDGTVYAVAQDGTVFGEEELREDWLTLRGGLG